MLRNLNKEFRGNELPEEPYSGLVRYGAVTHMENTCTPRPGGVKTRTREGACACSVYRPRCPERSAPVEARTVEVPGRHSQ